MDSALQRRALRLSYFTVGYNLIEGIVSIAAGLLAGSVALVGNSAFHSSFGLVLQVEQRCIPPMAAPIRS